MLALPKRENWFWGVEGRYDCTNREVRVTYNFGWLVKDLQFVCFSSRWHRSALNGPYALRPVSQQSTQGCPRNRANICLVERRSFSTLEGGMSAASFLHSSFLQAIRAVMLKPLNTSSLPSCRPDVISAVLASLSACSFPLTPACPGQ